MSAGTLHVVATPLGNLGDLSDRAKQVLRAVTTVAAEDTRRARVLLQHCGARPRVLSYHAHSPEGRLDSLLELLGGGDDVAVITDAGTPAVSDPGAELVRRARELGATVVTVPGPSAVAAALSISGFPADRYTFLGFLPRKGRDRRRLLENVSAALWTTVLFEAPPRLVKLLEDLSKVCGGEREAAVARELTKVHEELNAGTLDKLAVYYEENPPKGEVTVLIAGQRGEPAEVDEEAVRARARTLLDEGLSGRDTAGRLAEEFALPRREAYRIVTKL